MPEQADNHLRRNDPSHNPANLVVRIVGIQVGRLRVVNRAEDQAQRIGCEEDELRGKNIARLGQRQNDGFFGVLLALKLFGLHRITSKIGTHQLEGK